jgi:hypothetical protein
VLSTDLGNGTDTQEFYLLIRQGATAHNVEVCLLAFVFQSRYQKIDR